jgi:dTDP-4-dehydrorhamnose reductase
MAPRVLLLGASGQLGVELAKVLSPHAELVAFARQEVDLTDDSAVRAALRRVRPRFIVNAAAYTAVDRAESEPALAHAVNTQAPRVLAEEALAHNAWLLHFSTDYVFDGSGKMPFSEAASTHPLNVYGQTKLDGEKAIAATGCRHLIFRTSWVYSAHGNNFLRTMLRLASQRPKLTIVDDQIGAPTTTGELARGVKHVLGRLESGEQVPDSGVYHMTCRGCTSWFGFAGAIFKCFSGMIPTPEIVPIPSSQFPTPAIRPHNSRLDCGKLERVMGLRLAPWEEALEEVAAEIRSNGL